ncbi:serine/threonine protein kinase [Legionella sainthelensi]|uniref:Serine/threonine protein kinase n=2 Tax=Legionella sainthelensi TaxID=28087 RepID=A0A0W0YP27_9GAMM|nr:serine/threonine protein kinase [Legionella sainthelensi]VEH34441.1 serine/threonine protein kinase [Legionella sainthelensi]
MRIKQIEQSEENPKISRLNDLIEQYNQMHSRPNAIVLLQKIEAMRMQIYSDRELRKNGNFMEWYFTNPIAEEIRDSLKFDKDINLIFIENSKSEIKNLTLEYWKKITKHAMLGTRSKNCCKMDNLISEVEIARQNLNIQQSTQDQNLLKLKNSLEALQKQTLFMINNEILSSKRNTQENFETLLHTTNYLLKDLFDSYPELIRTSEHKDTSLIESLVAEDKKSQGEIFRRLYYTQAPQQLNEFNITHIGGGNNKIWLAENVKAGTEFIIRIENADVPKTDYDLVDEMKNDDLIKKNLAQDYFYCPVILPQQGRDPKRRINIAVSEFCPNGNLHNHHMQTIANSPETDRTINRCLGTLDAIEQVARIASNLNQKNMAYMDIKATNFLRRASKLITADTKSVVRTDKDNLVDVSDISTTFEPPEYRFGVEKTVNAGAYMAYQIGLMAYDLMVSTEEHNAQDTILDNLQKRAPLDFNLPIFKTLEGEHIKELIETILNPDPHSRPPLDVIIGKAQALKILHGNEIEERLEKNTHSDNQSERPFVFDSLRPLKDCQESFKQFKCLYKETTQTKDQEESLLTSVQYK